MKTAITIFSIVLVFVTTSCKREKYSGEWRDECIKNLQMIDGAKEQWALENRKNTGDPVTNSVIDAYIKNGAPRCPSGGSYTYGPIGTKPSCSILGHEL